MLERLESAPPPPEGSPPGSRVPIIAIGASAGGLEALRGFLGATPEDGGAAYVVILHLDPDRESQVARIVGRATSMPVRVAQDGVRIQPNHVYVAPPGARLEIGNGTLRIVPLPPRIPRQTIDHFFRSLVAARGSEAVGVVLSGVGRDGTLGLRAIREQGGIAAAQDPDDAGFPEMPRSAQAAGHADLVLPVHELPGELLAVLARHDASLLEEAEALPEDSALAMERIISRLEEEVGHSFRAYRRPTVLRRMHRRMRFCRSETLPEYARRIDSDGQERRELLQDLLLSVSRFFRDPEAFEALRRKVIPRLFEGKGRDDQVRVWVPGCATGEEAYSLSILLHEHAQGSPAPTPEIRIFATDIDERALEFARRGHYPSSIAEDVSGARLEQHFREDRSGYQILKPVRDSVVFAARGPLTDPTLPGLDLVSCRNVLVHLEPEAQRQAIERFHDALRSGGHLFLGPSESAPAELFETVAPGAHIFRRVPTFRASTAGPGSDAEARGPGARLLTLMDHTSAGVLIVDCGTREILMMNRRSREILDAGDEGADGSDRGERFELPDFLNRIVDRMVETGGSIRNQRVPFRRKGRARDLLVSGTMVRERSEGTEECILTLADIEDVLAHARELDEHAEETSMDFLATISHEFRTPLNAITGYTALLLEGLPDPLTEAQEQHVRRVRACAEQLAGMVEQILTLTHLIEGETPVLPETLDPLRPLRVAAVLIEPEATRRGLALRLEADRDAGEIVSDPERLRQILVNLAQNAVKYTLEGEVVLALRRGEEGGVVYEVRDTGIGISPDDLERIFDRFWQARPGRRPVGTEGAGIGLSVAKSLTDLLGGTIEVESERGRGSTFRVRIPASVEERSGPGSPRD